MSTKNIYVRNSALQAHLTDKKNLAQTFLLGIWIIPIAWLRTVPTTKKSPASSG